MLMAAHTHRACPFVAAHYFDTGKVATVTAHKNLSLTKSYLQSSSINLSDKNLGPSPILMLGAVLSTPSSAAVTSVDLSGNKIGGEGGTALVSALPSSNIKTLKIGKSFEIAIDEYDGTALDCSKQDFGPGEVIVVSWWLSKLAVKGHRRI